MVNKKGFLRTIEAVIAIIMILGLILYVTPSRVPDIGEVPGAVEQAQNVILEEMAINPSFRKCILSVKQDSCRAINTYACLDPVDQFIMKNLPAGYNFGCEICQSSASCINVAGLPEDKTVYTRDTFVSGRPPRVFRVYMWEL